jgi:hypothetical protein
MMPHSESAGTTWHSQMPLASTQALPSGHSPQHSGGPFTTPQGSERGKQ